MTKELEKLSPEQELRLDVIADEWIKIGRNTQTDRLKAESLIPDVYRAGDLEPPKQIVWEESPYAGYVKAKSLLDDPNQTPYPCYGPHDAHWLAFYQAFLEFGFEEVKKLVPLMDLAKVAGWFYPFDELCILTPNPIHLAFDAENRLHDENRKAVEYPDGWGLYVWHGIVIPDDKKHVIEDPSKITVTELETESNIEVRRVMMDRYGYERYIVDSKAALVQEDKWGQLFRKEVEGDEAVCMVRVRNSTPEPDGTTKHYFLRVPEDTKTAHEGIAWTFDVKAEDYNPQIET